MTADDHDHTHDHPHGAHGHSHGGRHHLSRGRRALGFILALTVAVCALEAVAGALLGSLALLSDAAHMLTDAVGLGIALAAAVLGTRKKSGRSTFGLRRLPVLGGLLNAVLVLLAAAFIVSEAFHRLSSPPPVAGGPVIVVALIGLLVNVVGAWVMMRSGDRSVNMRGAMLHMVGDALGSVAALASGIVLYFTNLFVVDAIASLVVAGIITVGSVRLILDVGSILLERAPAHVDVKAVEQMLTSARGVSGVVGFHAWELDSGEAVASLVLVTSDNDLARLAVIADELRGVLLAKFKIAHATIEWRPAASPRPCCDDEVVTDALPLAH